MNTVSVVIPVYNEVRTVAALVKAVDDADYLGLAHEVVIVDDGSTDGSRDVVEGLGDRHVVVLQPANRGKGAALRAASGRRD